MTNATPEESPQTELDQWLAKFLAYPGGAKNFITLHIKNPGFLRAIDTPQFQPLVADLAEHSDLLDGDERRDPVFKTIRKDNIAEFGRICSVITSSEQYERHLNFAEMARNGETRLDKERASANLAYTTGGLIRELPKGGMQLD